MKKFNDFVNEGIFSKQKDLLNVYAIDKSTNQEYAVEVLDCKNIMETEDNELSASIIVNDDDNVEILSVEPQRLHCSIVGLTGKDVRRDSLHRNPWILYIK